MDIEQPSFTDIEYGNRRRVSKREQFLETMNGTIPWDVWVSLIEPYYYVDRPGNRGRKTKPIESMLRMYLLQVWFSLSDEGVEDATLLHFRHLLEENKLGEKLLAAQNDIFETEGWIMRGGSIIDATIIAAPSSTKNATGTRHPEMHQTKKGNQWCFGIKAHAGVDAGTGYVHSVTATAANVHDLDEVHHLVRDDDEVAYVDAGYQGAAKRPEIKSDEHRSKIEWRVAARKGKLKAMRPHERGEQSARAGVRTKVGHPFLIVKRDFGFAKTRYRGIAKNLNHLHMLLASANWHMRERRIERRSHNYYRHGTTTLFAAVDIATGQVTGALKPKHRNTDFLAFLEQIKRKYRAVLDDVPVELHPVLDNYAAHKQENVRG